LQRPGKGPGAKADCAASLGGIVLTVTPFFRLPQSAAGARGPRFKGGEETPAPSPEKSPP
jgi:hypothetical protein